MTGNNDFVLSWLIRKLKPKILSAGGLGVWSTSMIEWASGWLSAWCRFRLVLELLHGLHLDYLLVPLCLLSNPRQIYKKYKTVGCYGTAFGTGSFARFSTIIQGSFISSDEVVIWAILLCMIILVSLLRG
jgi:hypothetical protein